jgi:uncharacterized protein YbjT (DUF2867 family)
MILVTGPTGNVGSELTRLLLAGGHKVRALIRDPGKAEALKKQGAEVALGDLDKRDSLREAVAGVEKAFLVSTMNPRMAEQELNFIGAAREAGVKHVVLLSTLGAGFQPGLKLGKLHRAGELALEASGMAWTVLRPSSFMSNFFANVASVKGQNAVYSCTGPAQYAPVDVRDIAAVAAKALTTPGHEGKCYALTGPELLTETDMTQKMAAALGRALNLVAVPVDAARGAMVGMGLAEWLANSLCEFYQAGVVEQAAQCTRDVQQVLGRAPKSFDDWSREFSAAFK